ncbi:hypothetical protein AB0B45_21650 [Nonomuraea sp. NPDC049152]|uniref:hypothetical protein n=1 Tax=Nonomuraea sp. NPDC049152 TaxID=3154350 RepID=UPI0033EB69CD
MGLVGIVGQVSCGVAQVLRPSADRSWQTAPLQTASPQPAVHSSSTQSESGLLAPAPGGEMPICSTPMWVAALHFGPPTPITMLPSHLRPGSGGGAAAAHVPTVIKGMLIPATTAKANSPRRLTSLF